MYTREKFAKRLKELRLSKQLTISQLADETKIGSSSICRWENCQADIMVFQLLTLANYFNVSLEYMVGLDNIK